MPNRITSMEQLKAESEQGAEFFILLNHGLRSSKDIVWDAQRKKFHIFNHIEQTVQHLTERQLYDRDFTNIGYRRLLALYDRVGFAQEARWVSNRLKTILGSEQVG